jgi:hypothetical protein
VSFLSSYGIGEILVTNGVLLLRFEAWLNAIDNHEARLFYETRGLPVPSDLGVPTKPGSTRSAAAKVDDGDESDDALGKGKINFKSAELEG